MDEVEVIGRIGPRQICVVNLIAQIRWRARVEDGREIGGGDFGAGEVVCYVDSPEAGARPNVEDTGWVDKGCEEEFVVQGEEPEMVSR